MYTEYGKERTQQRRLNTIFLPSTHGFCPLHPTTVVIEMLLTLGGRLSVPIYPSEIGESAIAYNGLLCDKITPQHARIEILDLLK